jgi:hypothetical protein
MPEDNSPFTPVDFTACLATLIHDPYADTVGAAEMADRISATVTAVGDQAGDLAAALSTVHNLTTALHAVTPATPGESP